MPSLEMSMGFKNSTSAEERYAFGYALQASAVLEKTDSKLNEGAEILSINLSTTATKTNTAGTLDHGVDLTSAIITAWSAASVRIIFHLNKHLLRPSSSISASYLARIESRSRILRPTKAFNG